MKLSKVDKYVIASIADGVPASELRKELTEAMKLLPVSSSNRRGGHLHGSEKLYVAQLFVDTPRGWDVVFKVGVSREPGERIAEVIREFSKYTGTVVGVDSLRIHSVTAPREEEAKLLYALEPLRVFTFAKFSGATEIFSIGNKKLRKLAMSDDLNSLPEELAKRWVCPYHSGTDLIKKAISRWY